MSLFRHIAVAFLAFSAGVLSTPISKRNCEKNVELLWQFPNDTWVENLYVRRDNQILVSLLTTPDLYVVDPSKPGTEPKLIHSFTNSTALFGIAEIEPDVFTVAATNHSHVTGNVPHTSYVWKVDFSANEDKLNPEITPIGPVEKALLVNGMCALPKKPGHILMGDMYGGRVFRMDTNTGDVSIAIPSSNSLVATSTDAGFDKVGVNGIHIIGDYLYVANVGNGRFSKIKINHDGTPAHGAEPVLIEHTRGHQNQDDFALADDGTAYLTTGGANSIVKVDPDGTHQRIAGHLNSTEIAGPTSAKLSRGHEAGKKVYAVTNGGLLVPVNGDTIVGGQVVAVDLE